MIFLPSGTKIHLNCRYCNKVEPAINNTGFYSSKIAIANQLVLISKVCANRRLNYLGPVVENLWENLRAAGE